MIEMRMKYRGEFHPVGQGLLHSTTIDLCEQNVPPYTYVYDCGTESELGLLIEELHRLKQLLGRSPLSVDLLILSHLHHDHVNGLPTLFESMDRIDTVILPYLFRSERMQVLAQSVVWGYRPTTGNEWYERFVRSPIEYLVHSAPGLERLILVRGDSPEPPEQRTMPERPQGHWLEEPNQLDPMEETTKQDVLVEEGERLARLGVRVDLCAPAGSYLGPWDQESGVWWDFELFQKVPPEGRLGTFREAVSELFEEHDVMSVLEDKGLTQRLSGFYRALGGKSIHPTSLAMFAGVQSTAWSRARHVVDVRKYTRSHVVGVRQRELYEIADPLQHRTTDGAAKVGCVTTGDLELRHDLFLAMCRHFGVQCSPQRGFVHTYQAPHHGSKHHWDRVQAKMPSPATYVLCASKRSQHRHPHKEVVLDILREGRELVWVNEDVSLRFDGDVWC